MQVAIIDKLVDRDVASKAIISQSVGKLCRQCYAGKKLLRAIQDKLKVTTL